MHDLVTTDLPAAYDSITQNVQSNSSIQFTMSNVEINQSCIKRLCIVCLTDASYTFISLI